MRLHPYIVGCRGSGIGRGRRQRSWAESLIDQAVVLNSMPATFSRSTSAYDDSAHSVRGAGVRRQRAIPLSRFLSTMADRIEGARANLMAAGSSEHVNTALWTITPANITATDGVTAIDGTATGFSLVETGTTTGHQVGQTIAKAASALVYTASVYVKNLSGSRDFLLVLQNLAATANVTMRVNPAAGTITAAASVVAGFTSPSGYITSVGNGWYRVVMTATSDTDTSIVLGLQIRQGATFSYTGDGTSGFAFCGMMVEQAAFAGTYISNRNLLLQTETLNTTWTKTDITVTSDALANPLDGLTTADLLTEGSAGTAVLQQTSPTVPASQTYTCSWYLKRGNNDIYRLSLINAGNTNIIRQWVNLNTGTLLSHTNTGTGTWTAATITAIGTAGWYRVTLSGTIGVDTAVFHSLFSASADASTTRVSGSTVYAYGLQLEYGGVATPYWAVAGLVGQRTAEGLSVDLSSIVDTRLNSVTFSEQFDNAAWTKTDTTITANTGATTDPNGNNFADLCTEGVAGTASVVLAANPAVTAAQVVTCSIYLKAGTATWMKFQTRADAGVNGVRGWFNIATGAAGTLNVLGSGVASSLAITSIGNGWYRVSITGAPTATGTASSFDISSASADGSTGRTANATYYAFGAQFERGATAVGAYIPTQATAVTASQTGLSTTTGTLLAIVRPGGWSTDQDAATFYKFAASNGPGAVADILIGRGSSTLEACGRNDGGTRQSFPSTSLQVNGATCTYAVAWDAASVIGYGNGVAAAAQTTLTAPFLPVTSVCIGCSGVVSQAYADVALLYFPNRKLVAAEILAITQAAAAA